MSDMRIGKFRVLGTLGQGAHSTILHIRREADHKEYALKVVPISGSEDRKFMDQAAHEFRVAQMMRHPNLIKVYAFEQTRDWFFRVRKVQLLIEYVDGQTLDKVGVLPMPKLLPVLQQVAAGLTHMHRRGVYHADLKPNNVLLSKRREAKIIDYGLAWIKGEEKGRIQGTPEYIAPETASKRVINTQTDIFNFGATMYRLVTWKIPPSAMPSPEFGEMDAATWKKLLQPVAELNPTVPAALAELIHSCMAFKPSKRPERMAEVQEQLDAIAEGAGVVAEEP